MDRWSKIREGEDGVVGVCGDEEVEAELNMEERNEVVEEDEEVVEEVEEVVEEEEEVVVEEEKVLEGEEKGVEEADVVEEEEEVVEEEEDGVPNRVVRVEVAEEDEGLGLAVEGGREEGQIADDLRVCDSSKPTSVGVRVVEVELLGRERASGARSHIDSTSVREPSTPTREGLCTPSIFPFSLATPSSGTFLFSSSDGEASSASWARRRCRAMDRVRSSRVRRHLPIAGFLSVYFEINISIDSPGFSLYSYRDYSHDLGS
ncbi:unnamed protein product [Closterium sp. Yama58-4]|nr:unnamed protein product [Closterium sp. Yama58-4]